MLGVFGRINFDSMIFSFLFWAFICYLGYRLLTGFIIPLWRTTRQVKRSFREMNERMNGTGNMQGAPPRNGAGPTINTNNTKGSKSAASTAGDYIDFEEVKD